MKQKSSKISADKEKKAQITGLEGIVKPIKPIRSSLPSKTKPHLVQKIKPFQGKGVKVSSAFDSDGIPVKEKKPEPSSFSGLKSKPQYQPKIEFRWRCTKWLVVNLIKNTEWRKCGQSRELTPEEEKFKEKEDIELFETKKTVSQILIDLDHELSGSELKTWITKMNLIISNIIENPEEEKYRTIKLDNKKFNESIGRHPDAIELLILSGFELKESEEDSEKMILNYSSETPSTMLKFTKNKLQDFIEVLKEEEEWKGE